MTFSSDLKASLGWFGIAVAIVTSTSVAAAAWERVKTRPADRTIQVTGSAKKRIVSDLIQWQASIETQNLDRTKAYRDLHGHMQVALAYLKEQGVKEDEIRASSADVSEVFESEFLGKGSERIERKTFKGYKTSQTIIVSSTNVNQIERVSREITQLLEKGVPISSSAPRYFYTKLGELKIEMLAEAAKDARIRADNMVKQTGGALLGKLRSADMGIINLNPANSTATSWEGNNDTESLEKDIITIVHVTFELN